MRINLIEPKALADQHLIAEYNEMLMLFGTVKKHPRIRKMPAQYCLGKGHITFFKDKLVYLKRRHEFIKNEMRRRRFTAAKTAEISEFPLHLQNDWAPNKKDASVIKGRIKWKLRKKPNFYRYDGKQKPLSFFLKLISEAKLP